MGHVKKVFVRTEFNYDMDEASKETGLACEPGSSLAVQSQAQESDINVIIRRAGVTGQLPQRLGEAMFGDFTQVQDYRSAMNAVAQVNGYFSNLPADLRARFLNDPQRFAEFCSDEANHPDLVKLGLLESPKAAAEPVEAPTEPPVAPAPAPAKTNSIT